MPHGSSSTTSPTPRVRVPRHVARLVVWLVVDYFASCKLIDDYFAYVARPGASTHRVARRRLLRLHRVSGCLGTSRGSSCGLSSTTLPTPRVWVPRHVVWLVVDYFAYIVRPGASAHRAARRQLACLTQARLRLLCLRRAVRCLGTSRGSSSTTPTPRVRVPRHLARLVIDYFAYTSRPGALARRAAERTLMSPRGGLIGVTTKLNSLSSNT
jgi:hypothetical protein